MKTRTYKQQKPTPKWVVIIGTIMIMAVMAMFVYVATTQTGEGRHWGDESIYYKFETK